MNQKSLEFWQHRIADRKISGLNVTDWCKENNLKTCLLLLVETYRG